MENQNAQNLAERLADLLQGNDKRSDEFLRSSLEKLNQRLDKIELQIFNQTPNTRHQTPNTNHHSQERFINLEELAIEPTNGLKDEKACPFEPAGKPCDHCAMCSSRGF